MHLRDDKFLINCSARTGSTLLVHLLNFHHKVLCHDEPFGTEAVGNIVGRYAVARRDAPAVDGHLKRMRDEQPARFLYDCVYDPQGHSAVGFKFKADESQASRYRHVTEMLVADRDIKVINLVRHDPVAQFVSHQMVLQQTGITLLRDGEPEPTLSPLRLDPELCVREVLAARSRYESARDTLAGHRSHEIAYEELLDPEAQKALLGFLGVPPMLLKSPTRKIINRPLEDLVPNLEELREAVRKAGLR